MIEENAAVNYVHLVDPGKNVGSNSEWKCILVSDLDIDHLYQ